MYHKPFSSQALLGPPRAYSTLSDLVARLD